MHNHSCLVFLDKGRNVLLLLFLPAVVTPARDLLLLFHLFFFESWCLPLLVPVLSCRTQILLFLPLHSCSLEVVFLLCLLYVLQLPLQTCCLYCVPSRFSFYLEFPVLCLLFVPIVLGFCILFLRPLYWLVRLLRRFLDHHYVLLCVLVLYFFFPILV